MAHPFARVAVIDNPGSGMVSARRRAALQETLAVLRTAGAAVELFTIDGPGSGEEFARKAIAEGFDSVLVCGGDGTVHKVLQPLVGTNVALGVIPMGTANALAVDLGLGRTPEKAVPALLRAQRVAVPVGRITFMDEDGTQQTRYFTVAAGVGADALLMARMDPVLKRRLGYALYVIEAVRIWLGHSFPLFQASFVNGSGVPHTLEASQLLAVRVRSFGGVLGEFVPGATLHGQSLRLVAFRTRSRLRYLRFLLAVMAGRHTFSRDVELLEADTVECHPPADTTVYVEADGDLLGRLPARIEVATETLTLLIPPHAQP